jgi:hypothetical protein
MRHNKIVDRTKCRTLRLEIVIGCMNDFGLMYANKLNSQGFCIAIGRIRYLMFNEYPWLSIWGLFIKRREYVLFHHHKRVEKIRNV